MKPKPKPGPEPERVKIDGDWADAVKQSFGAKKPPGGWPKPAPMPQRAKKPKAK